MTRFVKKTIAALLAALLLVFALSGCAKTQTDGTESNANTELSTSSAETAQPLATLITSSDYQNSGAFITFRILLDVVKEAGVPTPDAALFGGDYSIPTETDPDDSIRMLSEKLAGVYPDYDPAHAIFVQGNHDNATKALTPTGAHDFGTFVLSRKQDCSVLQTALREGKLPLRVTHNDTKLNNVLIDRTTGEGICVIDLDTTMPGLPANDFGDSIRFGANHSAEDEKDLTKVNFDLDLYRVYAENFIEGACGGLTEAERSYLPWGARLMTLECGIRFLTDYLDGDIYFHTQYPEQNLDRCRTQFKLVKDMEAQFEEMCEIIRAIP